MTSRITFQNRRRLARELVIGAPVAGLLWLLILRVFLGEWSLGFPLVIVGFSLVLALVMIGPEPGGSLAYRFWKGLIFVIDWAVTRVVCLFLYYLIFTPLGLVLRLLRVPLLRMRTDPTAATHWRKVSPPADDRRHYFRQY
ncbi:MAG: hypothetical protein ACP5I4_10460 [Oceanipulchritudo sp.]